MWAWCHVTPLLQTRVHWPPAKALSRSSELRRACLPACSPQEVFPQNWTPGSHTAGYFSVDKDLSQETSSGQPVALALILFHFHLQSRQLILWSTESSEDPLLFIFPATSHGHWRGLMCDQDGRAHRLPGQKQRRFSVCAAEVSTAAPVLRGSLSGRVWNELESALWSYMVVFV